MGERCGLQERMTKGTYSGQRTLHTLYSLGTVLYLAAGRRGNRQRGGAVVDEVDEVEVVPVGEVSPS